MSRQGILVAVLLLTVVACSDDDPVDPAPQAGFIFRVAVPATTPATDDVYLTGDFQGWDPGDPAYVLSQLPDERWEIQLTMPEGQAMEFKFTRGSWTTVEVESSGAETPNRTLVGAEGQVYELTVERWADQ